MLKASSLASTVTAASRSPASPASSSRKLSRPYEIFIAAGTLYPGDNLSHFQAIFHFPESAPGGQRLRTSGNGRPCSRPGQGFVRLRR